MTPQSNTAHTKAQKGRGKNHQHTARIHWVADDAVGTSRNDTLARPHFDNAGSPSILPQSEKDLRSNRPRLANCRE